VEGEEWGGSELVVWARGGVPREKGSE